VPGLGRGFEQIERAGDVDVDKGLHREARDIWFVQRAGMDDGFDAVVREDSLDQRPVRDRSDDLRVGARRNIEAGDAMTGRAQPRREETAKPTRRTGEEYAHAWSGILMLDDGWPAAMIPSGVNLARGDTQRPKLTRAAPLNDPH
jgi:hypothetical protein